MEQYDTLKAWGLDKNSIVSKKHHEQVVKELNTQVYRAYKRILTLKEENTQLKQEIKGEENGLDRRK
jgi:cell division protein FtsB